MKILMLSWEYPPRIVGGISLVVHDLTNSMAKKGNEVHIVTVWEKGSLEYEQKDNIHIHRVHPYDINTNNFSEWILQLNFALTEKAIQIMNKTKFDIIHAHDWVTAFAARTLKYAYNIPLISTIHATEHGRNNGIHNEIQQYIHSVEWFLTYESYKVICNSSYMKNEIKTLFQLPEDKLVIINNGIDLELFKNVKKDLTFRRNFAADNEKIIFFIGRLVQEKGVHVIVDAAPKILEHYNDTKFVICGKGPQFDYLRFKVSQLGIADRFYFTGYISRENILKIFKCADVATFPSLYEPFGIVALEGMLVGIPTVVSNTGGFEEIIEHGVDGMKSYVGNANSLADCVLEVLLDQKKANKITKNAVKKVKSTYNWDLISEQTLKEYKQIVKESKKAKEQEKYNTTKTTNTLTTEEYLTKLIPLPTEMTVPVLSM